MSTSAYWRPANGGRRLPYGIKPALNKRFGFPLDNIVLSGEHVEWLRGLSDAGVSGADALLSAIDKHDEIVISERE